MTSSPRRSASRRRSRSCISTDWPCPIVEIRQYKAQRIWEGLIRCRKTARPGAEAAPGFGLAPGPIASTGFRLSGRCLAQDDDRAEGYFFHVVRAFDVKRSDTFDLVAANPT